MHGGAVTDEGEEENRRTPLLYTLKNKSIKCLTFVAQYDTIITGHESEVIHMAPRTGRPTDNPKGQSIHIRLDSKCSKILEEYTEQEEISKAEAVRRGIEKLETDIKK